MNINPEMILINFIKKGLRAIVIFIMLPVFMLISFLPTASAEELTVSTAPVYVDGQAYQTKYFLKDGQLMVPALFLKEAGARVDWNEKYRSVVFRNGDVHFAAPVNKKYTDDLDKLTNTWKRVSLSTSPSFVREEIFVPIRDIATKLGMTVTYNSQLKRTLIETPTKRVSRRVAKGNTLQKYVALSFDDGPESHYTPQILDILKAKGVPGTFFVLGRQVQKYPEMLKRIVSEGHAIGNHTWSHRALPEITSSEVNNEIKKTQEEMFKTTGKRPDLFRPPFGALTRSDEHLVYELGFRQIFWSVDTLDWTGNSAEEILTIVHRDITPGGIILQHNIETDPDLLMGSIEALPKIIEQLQEKGYTFVTIQTLLDQTE